MNSIGKVFVSGYRSLGHKNFQHAFDRVSFNKLCMNNSNRYFSSNKSGKIHGVKDAQVTSTKESSSSSSSSSSSKSVAPTKGIENWKRELSSLATKEIEVIKESQDLQYLESNSEASSWFKKSGFSIEDRDDEIVLKKSTPTYDVEVHYSPHPEEDSEDNEEMNTEDMANEEGNMSDAEHSGSGSGSEAEDAESENKDRSPKVKAIPFQTIVTFKDNEGAFKGRLIFGGEVGSDCRLYVTEIQSNMGGTSPALTGKPDEPLTPSGPTAIFESFNQNIQDRMYDLLDDMGVDDRLGSYIRYYVDTYEDNSKIQILENIKKMFS